ncbi:MAG: nicotinate-nucleotide--dimethylbenzimidazole phosphoribosyltransferase [Gallionellaceae bacterium]|nr:nicotinate-nucleotide--dimethylbenzimidazole phosphoribosyltransferase [Gallionellaceae bacterium]
MTEAWWEESIRAPDETTAAAARVRQDNLTKPPGSLGRLEELAIGLAAMQGRDRPGVDQVWIAVFAGDHGVVAEGVSAFPQAVTQQMLANFVAGGAAIAVLARALGATLEVVDVGSLAAGPMPGVVWDKAGHGTANLATGPAMTESAVVAALDAGRRSVQRARVAGAELYVGGEMGIGNTTAAAALACALLGLSGRELAGPGTGLDSAGVAHKAAVLGRALVLHADAEAPLEALRCLGGYELAALAGAYIACARAGLPVLVDGFIATAAALAATRLNPGVRDWLMFGHGSAEPGHARLLAALAARPLLDLGMRLGEGSGAAVAVSLLRSACALHNGMATFAEAGVSGG